MTVAKVSGRRGPLPLSSKYGHPILIIINIRIRNHNYYKQVTPHLLPWSCCGNFGSVAVTVKVSESSGWRVRVCCALQGNFRGKEDILVFETWLLMSLRASMST